MAAAMATVTIKTDNLLAMTVSFWPRLLRSTLRQILAALNPGCGQATL
jgi:hypothetical protein